MTTKTSMAGLYNTQQNCLSVSQLHHSSVELPSPHESYLVRFIQVVQRQLLALRLRVKVMSVKVHLLRITLWGFFRRGVLLLFSYEENYNYTILVHIKPIYWHPFPLCNADFTKLKEFVAYFLICLLQLLCFCLIKIQQMGTENSNIKALNAAKVSTPYQLFTILVTRQLLPMRKKKNHKL